MTEDLNLRIAIFKHLLNALGGGGGGGGGGGSSVGVPGKIVYQDER